MDEERFLKMLKERFPEGKAEYEELCDWLKENAFQILTQCYDNARELLEDVSELTYDYIFQDLIMGEDCDDGLAMYTAYENIEIIEEEEEE